MTRTGLTVENVLALIAAYGAQPERWPEDERGAASAMVDADPARFEAALNVARLLDAELDDEIAMEPSTALSARILADAPAFASQKTTLFAALKDLILPQGVRWPAGAVLASLAMGLVGGYAYAASGVETGFDDSDQAYYAAFGYDDVEDWLVEGDEG